MAKENKAHTPSRQSAASGAIGRWKQQVLFGLLLLQFCIIGIAFTSQRCSETKPSKETSCNARA